MSRSSPSLTSLTVSEDDPGIFLELTEGKIAIGNEIKSNISRLILKVYEATDACGKLLESLVRFLDPTWDGTGSITSVTADVQAALNDLLNRLNKRLDVPMDAYIEQYRKLKPHVRKWKDCATQFSRKSKAYEQTRRKYKEHPKTEHARLEAISAQAESEHEGKVISWKLKKLNNAGVIACCKTWFVLLDSYTKLVDKMPPIINRLQNNVYILHDQASHNMLPEWRSTASEAGLTSVLSFPKRSSLPAVTVDHRPNRSQSATLAESKNDSPRLRDITPSVLPLDWDPLVSKGPLRRKPLPGRTAHEKSASAKRSESHIQSVTVKHRKESPVIMYEGQDGDRAIRTPAHPGSQTTQEVRECSFRVEVQSQKSNVHKFRRKSSDRSSEHTLNSLTVYEPKWRRDGIMVGIVKNHPFAFQKTCRT
ncbi:hypothetical protein CRM22_000030 [Opisthorchis felineus]|uniref:BAR domain-containing protein n=1 Tax=Opisthorchis felineus TaxID=147828 RepID=A0A4S2MGZ1_OPIFE|nr:hypothetical protein CRM22_000030 [Opisthorchis felineus]